MSKTYRNSPDGQPRTDGGRNYATPRYRAGSRRRKHNIIVTATRRQDVDFERFGRVIIQAAMEQAKREQQAALRDQEVAND